MVFPKMYRIRQTFNRASVGDIAQAVKAELTNLPLRETSGQATRWRSQQAAGGYPILPLS